ncbi:M28 family metallopeptidase [Jiangella rhizosphaerae]|uniref:M20/M25/M40 family metallo-hydrolase n=1 Tax=Jiangella rhizosphaerae TaxID=2293569 RepID=A0A418KW42_9ACTN|nr:M28 family metallopeptidase [Jiangella rhizosphaerae]RIQ34859.1 M20/M25/M40 family metallo-hydrolase [Jiangella rhizosphaerae]
MTRRPTRRTAALAGAGVLAATCLLTVPAEATSDNVTIRQMNKLITLEAVMGHLEALQEISDENGGNRASGEDGYDASVDYVVEQLEDAGYTPEVQAFEFDWFDERSELERVTPQPRVYEEGAEFIRADFDTGVPEGEATGALFPADLRLDAPGLPDNTSNSGCEPADFAGMAAGSIALVQRGTCGFSVKVLNAQAAGAAGVVVMNEGQPGRTGLVGMIGDATGLSIPAVFATFDAGANLASTPGATVRVKVDFDTEVRTTYNVFAETRKGNPDNVVMAGAHLDSVHDGAGINDNGTGSAALLETAIQINRQNLKNQVRFAWWGAEESGLLGSNHYVAELPQEELDRIALYLNFDMVGSPNYMFGIYDGDNSGGTAPEGFIPEGSAQIEDVFEQIYTRRNQPFNDSEFSGRSDYGAFIAEGIPSGGLFTGAEGVKTEEQAAMYGGLAGVAYDPCYHAFCDNLRGDGQDEAVYDALAAEYDLVGNVNTKALDINADVIGSAILTFAYDTSTVNGVKPRR